MHCPVDSAVLVMSERSGVEIDYCPQCRGVWLDRGELDKILDRAAGQPAPGQSAPAQAPAPQQRGGFPIPGMNPGYDRGYGHDGYKRRKKESWLSELFD
ncbi:zf-TFIIB domain-containing protein [Salinibacterium sp. SYSU T00001]|uniref:TFIIB-type zinc ribbon-containing protein n=1 Tax=Homoserinimonas sedimenticola TaxID=2986805 RepID=UPI0022368CE7|nr:zf-TFIIB domain-containing protein [Salinibacterium sedimenticola]MCW4386386.1 zf-TFIIB domain-containing protein [Salinibacterium sedimenticola]